MSLTPILVCDKFKQFVTRFESIEDAFRSDCFVVSHNARFVALGRENVVWILGTAKPDRKTTVTSTKCTFGHRPISSLFTTCIPYDNELLDIILVGTSDGWVMILNVDGLILFELHTDSHPIRSIQLCTDGELRQLAILCSSGIVCLDWEELVFILCKSHSAVLTHGSPLDFLSGTMQIQCQTLTLPVENKNFQLMSSEPTSFGLFNDTVRNTIHSPDGPVQCTFPNPVKSLWAVTGQKPFITFNLLQKTSPSLRSLLLAEAKRMIFGSRSARTNKHILPVQLISNEDGSVTPTASYKAASSINLEFARALTDQHREACPKSMVISADHQWFAITDNLGRVLLVDAQRERVARIWKGYRDAQVAFFEVTHSSASPARGTRCLMIHAPHRRILELFRLVHGPCLSTWDVEEPIRLIPAHNQITGDLHPPQSTGSGFADNGEMYQLFLLDSKGTLYTLELSPDLCLAETDAEAALGYHEYQVMQACHACLSQIHTLGPTTVSAQLLDHFRQFKSAVWFEQAIRHVHLPIQTFTEFISDCVVLLTDRAVDQESAKYLEFQRLRAQLSKMHSLMQFYQTVAGTVSVILSSETGQFAPETNDSMYTDAWVSESESIADLLNWDREDAARCLSVYAMCSQILRPSSHLQLTEPISIRAFLDCFKYVVDVSSLPSGSHTVTTQFAAPVHLTLQFDDTASRLSKIGAIIFGPYLTMIQSYEDLLQSLSSDILNPTILLYALTCYILRWDCFRRIPNLIRRIHRLYAYLLAKFCELDLTKPHAEVFNCSEQFPSLNESLQQQQQQQKQQQRDQQSMTPFQCVWEKLYAFVVASSQLSSAYLLCLVFRSLLYQAWESVDRGSSIVTTWHTCAQFVPTSRNGRSDEFLGADTNANPSTGNLRSEYTPTTHAQPDSPSVPLVPVGCEPVEPIVPLSTLNTLVDQWHDTCTQLEDLFILGLLVQLPAVDTPPEPYDEETHESTGFPITLSRALTCGRACLTELFASWIVRWRMQPHQLMSFYQSMCEPSQSTPTSDSTVLALVDPANLKRALFPLVYKRLPFTLELDVVVASICWIYYQRWISDVKVTAHLHHCIEFLRRLSSAGATIAQGMCSLMWKGDLGLHFQQCINAVCMVSRGRTKQPIDKTVQQKSILIMRFFTVYAHAFQRAEVVPVFSIEREWSGLGNPHSASGDVLHYWGNRTTEASKDDLFGRTPESTDNSVSRSHATVNLSYTLAAEVAVNQPLPKPQSIALWEQSVIVVAAMCTFSLLPKRNKQPGKSSYESTQFYQVSDFFLHQDIPDLFVKPMPNWISRTASFESDMGLDNRRRFFISWLIDRAVQTYGQTFQAQGSYHDSHANHHSSPLRDSIRSQLQGASSSTRQTQLTAGRYTNSSLDLYTLFTNAAMILALHWGFSRDVVLSQHVIVLFEANLDEQAELYLSQVEDTGSLATRLLIVVGRRVAWQCFGQCNPEAMSYQLRWRACIPFDLESWLRGLLSECDFEHGQFPNAIRNNRDPGSELKRLVRLIDFVTDEIPNNANQAHVAEALRDTIYAMSEVD